MRILLIDDDPKMVESCLKHFNYQVDVAQNGADGIHFLTKCNRVYDLVILDIMMPVLDGWDTLKVIRSTPETSNIYVLMLTANEKEDALIQGFERGADQFLVKPVSPRKLKACIEAISSRLYPVKPGNRERYDKLTPREIEILELLKKGLTNKKISEKLYISPPTVKNHIAHIYRKLGTSNRVQATCLANG